MAPLDARTDLIIVNELVVHAPLGPTRWPKPGSEALPQPLRITAKASVSVSQAGVSDQLVDSVNYSSLAKVLDSTATKSVSLHSLESLAEAICTNCFAKFPAIDAISVAIAKKAGLLHAERVSYELVCRRHPHGIHRSATYSIRDLRLSTIIGIHPWERVEKQIVCLNLDIDAALENPYLPGTSSGLDASGLVKSLSTFVLDSDLETVESLVAGVSRVALSCPAALDSSHKPAFESVTVRVAKPSALLFADSAEIQITRSPRDLEDPVIVSKSANSQSLHYAVLALGANLGDRIAQIELALSILEANGILVLDTSYMYETAAMYVESQPNFANAACLITTTLSPRDLLSLLKATEVTVGRTKTFRNGPRVVDLDIIFYDELVINEDAQSDSTVRTDLTIPHLSMLEREFVLRPLADILPDYPHPRTGRSIKWHLDALQKNDAEPMRKIISFPPHHSPDETSQVTAQPSVWPLGKRTYIMATLNATPDSFSDGGLNNTVPNALAYAQDAVKHGADIIDVGGYSTRPGAADVSPDEEILRVVPVINALRESGITVPISIDTFRATVAQAAIDAGANCINDVRALREPGFPEVAKRLPVPVILMHSRGTDASADKDYGAAGVMQTVKAELGAQVRAALSSGIRRWNIIVDPGVGFSKTVAGNLEMIRDLSVLTAASSIEQDKRARLPRTLSAHVQAFMQSCPLVSMPTLVGTSRKSYLGTVIGRPQAPAAERDSATLAAVVGSIQQGCDIIRVHNVTAGKDAALVADELYRQ